MSIALSMTERLGRHLQAHQQLLAPEVPLAVHGRLVRVSGVDVGLAAAGYGAPFDQVDAG